MKTPKQPGPCQLPGTPPLPFTDNLDNIPSIERMWRAQWPEFSWLTRPGQPDTKTNHNRCYQMFAPDISRVGYGNPDATGCRRVWAIMCPQQGIWIETIGATLNIEVTVTKVRGWVSGDEKTIDAELEIKPKIWFSPDSLQNSDLIIKLQKLFKLFKIPFPDSKANAITLGAHGVDQHDHGTASTILTVTPGLDGNYDVPSFARHDKADIYGQKAATIVHLAVEIGTVNSTGSVVADAFNNLVMQLFNLASGNLLQAGNVLSWNVWALAPEQVYTPEWKQHAQYWRFSLDVNHRSPEGNGRNPQYYDGTPFSPERTAICALLQDVSDFLQANFPGNSTAFDIEAAIALIRAVECAGAVQFL